MKAFNLLTLAFSALHLLTAPAFSKEVAGAAPLIKQTQELVFMDATLADLPSLQAGTRDGVETIIVDAGTDFLSAVTATLAQRSGVKVVSLISHAAPGVLMLGHSRIDFTALEKRAGEIGTWRHGMIGDGVVVFYGCDLAAQPQGRQWIEHFAKLSGLGVEASTNKTGSVALGGDWEMEAKVGNVAASDVLVFKAGFEYRGLLPVPINGVDPTFNTVYVRPGGTSNTWVFGPYNSSGNAAAGIPDGPATVKNLGYFDSAPNDILNRGKFQYSTNGGSTWTDMTHNITDVTQMSPISGKMYRFLDQTPSDTTNNDSCWSAWGYVLYGAATSTGQNIIVDNEPTDVSTLATDYWATTNGELAAGLTKTDTGNPIGGVYAIDSQGVSNLFTVSGTSLALGSGTLPAVGATATVTLRYNDYYQTDNTGAAIAGQGVTRTMTMTRRANPSGFSNDAKANTFTTNSQSLSQVAGLSDGSYVVVWRSVGQDGETTSNGGIYGQKFTSVGVASGSEFAISPANNGKNESNPVVAALAGGRFVVAYTQTNTDGDVIYRIVEANGTLGAELNVTAATGIQSGPSITALQDGNFAIAFLGPNGADTGDVWVRKFTAAAGAPVANSELVVNTTQANTQSLVWVSALSDGNYIVSWRDSANAGDIKCRVMGPSAAVSAEIAVVGGAASQTTPRCTGLTGGGFVVVYNESGRTEGSVVDTTSQSNVYARRYDNAGSLQGSEFLVNGGTLGNQISSGISRLSGGGFVIGFSSNTDPDGSFGIFGRRYDATGTAVDSYEFQMNQRRTDSQTTVNLAALNSNGFAASWSDSTLDGTSDSGIGTRSFTGAAPTAPEIAVMENAANVADGGTFSFGTTTVGTPVTKTFTITNSGTANLTLSNLTVPSGFSIAQNFGSSTVAPGGGTTTFQITMSAASASTPSGTLTFDTNDTDENPYNFTISGTVNASTNADLSALSTTASGMAPAFGAATTSYTASVPNATTTATVTATRADANATLVVQVNSGGFNPLTSGTPSSALALNIGTNTIDVKVTAQDGTTTKIYTITVTRIGPPTQLAFVQHPTSATAGASISPAVTVRLLDALGNLTTSTANVTLAIGTNPGSGTLTGTATVAAVNGLATFSGLSINKSGTGYTLAASSGGLTGATSSSFNITAGTASQLAFSQQPTNTVAGASISPAVTVRILDTNGNLTTSTANVTLAIGTNPGSGTLSGTATVAASGGVATFSGLSINKSGTGYTLAASSGALTGATSSTFNITAGTASQLAFLQQPTNTVAGASISPAVTVRILDTNGNLTTSTANVTLAIGTNPGSGTLSGTATVAASSGVATFSGLSINKSGTGYTLAATSGVLTGATSSTFNITAGAASQLTFSQQPTNSVAGVGISPAVTVQILDTNGNLTTSTSNVTLAIGTNPNSGTLSGTATVAASSGVATFTGMNINKSGTGYTLTASSGALTGATSSTFNITPAAAASLVVSAPSNATAGTSFNTTVTANDAFGNTAIGYAGTVHFTSTDGTAMLPADSLLTNGVGTFSVTLKTAGNQTISATDTVTSGITGTSGSVNVSAAAATSFAVSAPSSATAGSQFSITVTALDAFNNTSAAYAGTVQFTSSDGSATLPTDYTFVAGDNGVHTFTNSVTLKTAGSQTITAIDTVTSSITGTSGNVTVNAAAATRFMVNAPSSATAGSVFNVTVTALDQFDNTATGYSGTVHFTSADGSATLPADGTLTNGVGTSSVTLKTAGSQTITATDTVTSSITGTSGTVTVSAAAATRFTVNAPSNKISGESFNVTLTALDAFDNTAIGYTGTVHFTTTDGSATLPADYTFVAGDNGVHTFTAESTLRTPGSQTITATDTVTSSITGTSNTVTVDKADTSTTITSSQNPSLSAQNVTFTATVTTSSPGSGTPTGNVIFSIDSTPQTPSTLDGSGKATFSINSLSLGTHTISASYAGDSQRNSSNVTLSGGQLVKPLPTITTNTANLAQNATQLIISGTNFSTTASDNTVTLSSGTATVTAATATQLTCTLAGPPSLGALNASVTISNNGGSAGPTQVATIVGAPTATQNTANLRINAPTLIITGTNFSATPSGNVVALSSGPATVTAATTTQLTCSLTGTLSLGSLTATVTSNGGTSGTAVQVANVIDLITIAATTPTAVEGGATGLYTFTRLNNSGDQTVAFQLDAASTATAGTDFTLSGSGVTFNTSTGAGTIVIPNKQSTATLTLTALAESPSFAEPNETARLNLVPTAGVYDAGTPSTALVTISANGLIVTNTANSGSGSLRQAILNANANSGTDTITFNIPGSAPYSIKPATALPIITEAVLIDATTQPGYAGTPVVEIDGTLAGVANGLILEGGGSTIRGFAINRFPLVGILIRNGGSNKIEGSYIGTDISGTTDLGNTQDGVLVIDSPNNTIGGTTLARRNLISGNDRFGICLRDAGSTGNLVQGNSIGTNAAGTADLGNTLDGILLNGSPSNTIGGTTSGTRNIISGNDRIGLSIFGAAASGNIVQGNYIGLSATGITDLGNTQDGILINGSPTTTIGGTASGARNFISGNNRYGIYIYGIAATGTQIQGNYIGTGAGGNGKLANAFDGILVNEAPANTIGGTSAAARNIISGNDMCGISILGATATGNLVQGNSIGVGASGTSIVGNAQAGIRITDANTNTIGGTATGAANTIANNGGQGVTVTGTSKNNPILRNSMFSNTGPGIDLQDNGVTFNDTGDADTGPNNLQNFPVISSAVLTGANLTITYSVPSVSPNSTLPLRVEFFIADTSVREGMTYLGASTYTAPNQVATIPAGTAVLGTKIVATATDNSGAGSTSEFSAGGTITATITGPVAGIAKALLPQIGGINTALAPATQHRDTAKTTVTINPADGLRYRTLVITKAPGTAHQRRIVEVSSNLTDWTSGSHHTTVLRDDATLLIVRDNTPLTPGTKRHIRLRP